MARSSNVIIEQILNKVLNSGNVDFIMNNGLTEEYFPGYEDEFYFILDHYEQYGKAPDKITFADEFPDFNFFIVDETDDYLYRLVYELRYYNYVADGWEEVRSTIEDDPVGAMEKFQALLSNAPKMLTEQGINIIAQAMERFQLIVDRMSAEQPYYIKTGFDELDAIINGWARGEEFVCIFGRTGHGKSWILLKSLANACKLGNRVGFISPEMSPDKVGFRADTLLNNFSNRDLTTGDIVKNDIELEKYRKYCEELSKSNDTFIVATPADFNKRITVSKLRNFILKNKLDILAIDGITYLKDERSKRGDNKTIALTNVSEDLITLTNELKVPIIVAVQSNRGGVKTEEEDGAPEIENIRDSDGIAHNCTKIISIRQVKDKIDLVVKKHRDGKTGDTVSYYWDPNFGHFEFVSVEKERSSYKAENGDRTDSNNSKTAKGKPTTMKNKDIEGYDAAKEQRKKKVRDF